MPARQWEIGAAVQPQKVGARETFVSDYQPGAPEADRCSFLDGETDGLGGGAEGPWSLGKSGSAVAAEIKLGASLIV